MGLVSLLDTQRRFLSVS